MDDHTNVTRVRAKLSPLAEHRRQMTWQVWVPLAASIVIFLGLVILTVIGAVNGSSEVARWANISAVWIILPMLLVGFLLLIVVAGSAFGMAKLLNKIPGWMLRIQLFMEHFALVVRRAADAATQPVMAANGLLARVETFWRKVRGKTARKSQAGVKMN